MKEIPVKADGSGTRLAIVVSRFNEKVTDGLLAGCFRALAEQGVKDDDLTLLRVPGAFELPLACDRLAASGRYDGIIALGCVIRGQTAHFDFIAGEATRGLGETALKHSLPVGFGILTTENSDQALERSDPEQRDKGREVAIAVLEMVNLLKAIS